MAKKIPTLDEVMGAEIKQDLASRYFGFRKLIEEDALGLEEKARQHSFILQKRISFDLIRIYVLLHDDGLIKKFLALSGLNEELFYDPYLIESENIARRVLVCQEFRGWTRTTRFRNYILDCYDRLTLYAGVYRSRVEELLKEQKLILEEIEQFYRKNDISAILHFVQKLGEPRVSGDMQGGMETGLVEGLADKLQIEPPRPIEQVLFILPPLKPLAEIKNELKELIRQAYAMQPSWIFELFSRSHAPCERREGGNGREG